MAAQVCVQVQSKEKMYKGKKKPAEDPPMYLVKVGDGYKLVVRSPKRWGLEAEDPALEKKSNEKDIESTKDKGKSVPGETPSLDSDKSMHDGSPELVVCEPDVEEVEVIGDPPDEANQSDVTYSESSIQELVDDAGQDCMHMQDVHTGEEWEDQEDSDADIPIIVAVRGGVSLQTCSGGGCEVEESREGRIESVTRIAPQHGLSQDLDEFSSVEKPEGHDEADVNDSSVGKLSMNDDVQLTEVNIAKQTKNFPIENESWEVEEADEKTPAEGSLVLEGQGGGLSSEGEAKVVETKSDGRKINTAKDVEMIATNFQKDTVNCSVEEEDWEIEECNITVQAPIPPDVNSYEASEGQSLVSSSLSSFGKCKEKGGGTNNDGDIEIIDVSIDDNTNVARKSTSKCLETSDGYGKKLGTGSHKPNKPRQLKCFNCGGQHWMRNCRYALDQDEIEKRRKEYYKCLDEGRYGRKETKEYINNPVESGQVENEHSKRFRPGILSLNLRKALGLKRADLPEHIYRMRQIGYPPGWLQQAIEYPPGKEPYICESKLPVYQGFNTPVPFGVNDDGICRGARYSPEDSIKNIVKRWDWEQKKRPTPTPPPSEWTTCKPVESSQKMGPGEDKRSPWYAELLSSTDLDKSETQSRSTVGSPQAPSQNGKGTKPSPTFSMDRLRPRPKRPRSPSPPSHPKIRNYRMQEDFEEQKNELKKEIMKELIREGKLPRMGRPVARARSPSMLDSFRGTTIKKQPASSVTVEDDDDDIVILTPKSQVVPSSSQENYDAVYLPPSKSPKKLTKFVSGRRTEKPVMTGAKKLGVPPRPKASSTVTSGSPEVVILSDSDDDS